MEVHTHSHTERKRFTHYIWEFLMLFLAVSAGFFVENIREHMVEKKRATVLAAALIKDLQKDTAQLTWLLDFGKVKKAQIDSFCDLLNQPFNQIPSRTYYHLATNIQSSFDFAQTNGTINQLKNAGYLRYFSIDSLPGFLSEYDFLYKDAAGTDAIVADLIYNKFYALEIKTSDSRLLRIAEDRAEVPDSIGILPIAADDLKALKGIVVMIRRNYTAYQVEYNDLRTKAVQIMEYLHRSLHLQ